MGGTLMSPKTRRVSTDTALQLASTRPRRRVLQYLIENGNGVASFDELVGVVTQGRTAGRPVGDERIATELRHIHLPKLAEAAVIRYDIDAGTVGYRPDERIERVIRFVCSEVE